MLNKVHLRTLPLFYNVGDLDAADVHRARPTVVVVLEQVAVRLEAAQGLSCGLQIQQEAAHVNWNDPQPVPVVAISLEESRREEEETAKERKKHAKKNKTKKNKSKKNKSKKSKK